MPTNKHKQNITHFTDRKKEHIQLSLKKKNSAKGQSGLKHIQLRHSALPELDLSEVDISTHLFGQTVLTPFVVTGMTGGWEGSLTINQRIARLCAKRGWVMGVGSQRRGLFDPSAAKEWEQIRAKNPKLILLGNIGLSQLIQTKVQEIEKLVLALKANAMVVHTNPLQEALQVQGLPRFKGGLKSLQTLCANLSVPVILKETGCGFSKENLKALVGIGLFAVDVSGYGGTHWGRVEGDRVPEGHFLTGVAKAFKKWGISTLDSLLFAQELKKDYEVWASGGLSNGPDFAKALALKAQRVGLARPIMEASLQGDKALDTLMTRLEYELKVAMFCSGSPNIQALQKPGVWSWKRKHRS